MYRIPFSPPHLMISASCFYKSDVDSKSLSFDSIPPQLHFPFAAAFTFLSWSATSFPVSLYLCSIVFLVKFD